MGYTHHIIYPRTSAPNSLVLCFFEAFFFAVKREAEETPFGAAMPGAVAPMPGMPVHHRQGASPKGRGSCLLPAAPCGFP